MVVKQKRKVTNRKIRFEISATSVWKPEGVAVWNYGYVQKWLSVHEWETDFRMENTIRDRETRGTPTAMEMDDNRGRNNGE